MLKFAFKFFVWVHVWRWRLFAQNSQQETEKNGVRYSSN